MICCKMIPTASIMALANCTHSFCHTCLKAKILPDATGSAPCPYPYRRYKCKGILEDTEIEGILGKRKEDRNFTQRQLVEAKEPNALKLKDLIQLVTLTEASIVPNPEPFECSICLLPYGTDEGVILRECFHMFCRECLAGSIINANDVIVKCPSAENCESEIQEREIKQLLSEEDFSKYLDKSLRKAEAATQNSFHCLTPNCIGWCEVAGDAGIFICQVCYQENCLVCKVIHTGQTCQDNKRQQEQEQRIADNLVAEQTLKNLVDSGQAMRCPTCLAVLSKSDGCDWMVCAGCSTEICWATRGPRWGPNGPGDISGGCRCQVNGVLCHQDCQYCH
ncbi:ranBP-type and C3HC4-type zinc finger-containing protein 1-like [Culex pipiens pallens]|uniref:ranBP-type and C3HC4-type zinc finger-containing protein 1-like n=1 Tax=Culex pipiens pallens TaxID=42434 RepID=UPI0022AA64B4|nr:ranBP-type and C3HC4-type zinc finger-containing protein 1-like [Culex pipiens pallens]